VGSILKGLASRYSSSIKKINVSNPNKPSYFTQSALMACAFIPNEPSPEQMLQRLRENKNSEAGRFVEQIAMKWKSFRSNKISVEEKGGEIRVAVGKIADAAHAAVQGFIGDIPDAAINVASTIKDLVVTFSWYVKNSDTQKKLVEYDHGVLTICMMTKVEESKQTFCGMNNEYFLRLHMAMYRMEPNSPAAEEFCRAILDKQANDELVAEFVSARDIGQTCPS
jgi:hypothetical protein